MAVAYYPVEGQANPTLEVTLNGGIIGYVEKIGRRFVAVTCTDVIVSKSYRKKWAIRRLAKRWDRI